MSTNWLVLPPIANLNFGILRNPLAFAPSKDMVSMTKALLLGTIDNLTKTSFSVNEKNFVGLATDGDFIACGSENNALFVYYKGLAKQVLTFWFDSSKVSVSSDLDIGG